VKKNKNCQGKERSTDGKNRERHRGNQKNSQTDFVGGRGESTQHDAAIHSTSLRRQEVSLGGRFLINSTVWRRGPLIPRGEASERNAIQGLVAKVPPCMRQSDVAGHHRRSGPSSAEGGGEYSGFSIIRAGHEKSEETCRRARKSDIVLRNPASSAAEFSHRHAATNLRRQEKTARRSG